MLYKSILIFIMTVGTCHAVDFAASPPLQKLVEVMVREDGYPRTQLETILGEAVINKHVIRAMNRQYEALPWHQYRQRFLTAERISQGVAWWERHDATLQQAAQQFGVRPAIIVALIGVETNYGVHVGTMRVLDSLVTLTADFPRRSAYFSRELRAFLNTARAEGIAPQSILGSFAGAVGIPQFMPTSYEAYAVDLNGNGRRDLAFETADAIGSVANYLKKHGWRTGQAVFASLPEAIPATAAALISKKSKPRLTAAQLMASGVKFDTNNASEKMALLRLPEARGYRHIVGFYNFYVITRYNISVNYALVVAELAQRISAQREQ